MTDAEAIRLTYTNHRGEKTVRYIMPSSIRFGTTEYHPEPQWLMTCWDFERGAPRTYALSDCDFTRTEDA